MANRIQPRVQHSNDLLSSQEKSIFSILWKANNKEFPGMAGSSKAWKPQLRRPLQYTHLLICI